MIFGSRSHIISRFSITIETITILKVVTLVFLVALWQFNLLKPTGHVMHHQFNIQQLYVLPTLYLCVLYLSQNKQRLVPLTLTYRDEKCLQRGTDWVFK